MTVDQQVVQWLSNSPLLVRLMRYRLYKNIDINLDLSPKYNQNLNIGVVIGTYGSISYLDLQLYYLTKVNGITKILIHDDCSNKQDELKQLCKEYNIDYYCTPYKMWQGTAIGCIGDQNCFYEGLKWAKENDLDILVKLSRRLLPCYRWIDDFKKLVLDSDGITFSSYCSKDNFPIRTELIGMNVNAWTNDSIMSTMKWYIDNNYPSFAEFWTDEVAKMLDFQNYSEKYQQYKLNHKTGYIYSGYVHWYDILGTCRYNKDNRKNEKILWHQYSSKKDYFDVSKEIFSDKYLEKDFEA